MPQTPAVPFLHVFYPRGGLFPGTGITGAAHRLHQRRADIGQRLPCQRDGGEGFRVGFKEFQRPAGEQIEPRRVHR